MLIRTLLREEIIFRNSKYYSRYNNLLFIYVLYILMGTGLVKNYNVDKEPYLTAGYKNLWKVYKGTHKIRETLASIFVLDKKSIDVYSNKDEREELLLLLKKEAQAIQKFKHPGILGVQESLLEDKSTLVYVTEYVPHSLSSWLATGLVSKLEIKLLFIEVCEVFRFLQEDAKVIHSNISPDCIFLDEKGKLKLSGFNLTINDPPVNGAEFILKQTYNNTYPNLSFISPDVIFNKKINYKSDNFSLGLLLSYLLNKTSQSPKEGNLIELPSNNVDTYKRFFDNNFSTKMNLYLSNLDQDDKLIITELLNKSESNRPSISEIKDNKWFQDFKLNALTFIDNLEANDQNKNKVFLTQFPSILSQFDEKIVKKKILPKFLDVLHLETLIVLVTPCIISIAESKTIDVNFETVIWPNLKSIFKMKQIPAATLFYLITKVEFIANNLSQSEFTNHMLNIVCKSLDCDVPKIQAVVLQNLSSISKKIESQVFKNQIYQRLANILLSTKNFELMLAILKNLKSTLTLLDKTTINDNLLMILEKLRKQNNKLETCKYLVDIYEEISIVVNIESIANKILPNLISILVSGEITQELFSNIMQIVQKYLDKIKAFRQKDFSSVKESTFPLGDDMMKGQGGLYEVNSTNTSNTNSMDFLSQFFNKSSTSSNQNQFIPQINTSQNNQKLNDNNNMIDFSDLDSKPKNSNIPNSQSNIKKHDSKKDLFEELNFDDTNKNKQNIKHDVNYDAFFNEFDNKPKKPIQQTNKINDNLNFDFLTSSTQQNKQQIPISFDNVQKQTVKKDDPFNFDDLLSGSKQPTKDIKKPKKNDLEDLLNF